MAFSRSVVHPYVSAIPDGGDVNLVQPSDWNATHTATVVDATSGGIPYFSGTTTEASSALLAAGAIVLGGGAATAPLTSTKLTESATAGGGLLIAAGTATTDVNALSITQTWNAAGVTFEGIKLAVTDTASAAGSKALELLGGAGAATNLFSVSKGGAGTLASDLTLSSGFLNTGSGDSAGIHVGAVLYITSPGTGIMTIWDNGQTDFNRLQFGGKTSSFPSLKRATTGLEVRLADDSNYGPFTASAYSVGATAGASFGPGLPTTLTFVNGICTAAA